VQAVIMAGGKGLRLRPLTTVLPKPLIPLGESSIIEMVMRQLRHFGFDDVVVAVGYKSELIMAVLGDGSRYGLNVRYHHEDEPLGTLGALASIADLRDHFLVMNGDICTNMDFGELLGEHRTSGALATVSAYLKKEQVALGVLDVDPESRRITGFREKPTYDFLVAMGVNAFSRSVLDLVPKGASFGFDDLMHSSLEKGLDVRHRLFEGLWYDIGHPHDYDRVLDEISKNANLFLPTEQ
jgi:NDP-sugar pyrophosphorylase family protein